MILSAFIFSFNSLGSSFTEYFEGCDAIHLPSWPDTQLWPSTNPSTAQGKREATQIRLTARDRSTILQGTAKEPSEAIAA